VQAINSMSCTTTSQPVQVIVVPKPDAAVLQHGSTLTAVADSLEYQWLNCAKALAPIVGATERLFTPSQSGIYALTVSKDGCSDTSSCVEVSLEAVPETPSIKRIIFYPNPTTGIVTISDHVERVQTVRIVNVLGEPICASLDATGTKIDLSQLPNGVYYLQVETKERVIIEKLIKY
jgi:hypothetical protein